MRRLACLVLAALAAGALAMTGTIAEAGPREALFHIPKGTWARRSAGEQLDILPDRIRLVAGTVLVLRNLDDVPQVFGPTLIMPGQALRLPFDMPAEYQFACTAHASGQMTVLVEETFGSFLGACLRRVVGRRTEGSS